MKPKKHRIDWEAVERDYRTAKFTLRELEAKHNVSYAEVSRKAKKEGWTKDLSSVIRNATNAALLEETTKKAQKDVTNTVLAAAELNKQVILGHRKHVQSLQNAVADAQAKVLALGDSVADIREAAVLAGAVESLSRTQKNLIALEREAFGIATEKDDDGIPMVLVKDLTGRKD